MKQFRRFLFMGLILIGGIAASNYSYTGPNRYTSQQVWQRQVEGQTCTNSGGWRYIVEKIYACDTPGEPWKTEYPNYYPCSSSTNGNKVYATTCQQVTVTVRPNARTSPLPACLRARCGKW